MMENKKNLAQRLIAVRESVTNISKDGLNPHHNFKYASSSAVLSAIRPAMDREGVLLVPRVTAHEVSEIGKQMLTCVDMEYTWINADNQEDRITCSWYAQGIDAGERGVGKAYTYGEKYFICKFFNIPTDSDDPDSEKSPEFPDGRERKVVSQKTYTPSTTKPASDKQRGLVWGLAKSVYGETAKARLDEMVEKRGWVLAELTSAQASEMIEYLQEAEKER
jgi:hypothetical protein